MLVVNVVHLRNSWHPSCCDYPPLLASFIFSSFILSFMTIQSIVNPSACLMKSGFVSVFPKSSRYRLRYAMTVSRCTLCFKANSKALQIEQVPPISYLSQLYSRIFNLIARQTKPACSSRLSASFIIPLNRKSSALRPSMLGISLICAINCSLSTTSMAAKATSAVFSSLLSIDIAAKQAHKAVSLYHMKPEQVAEYLNKSTQPDTVLPVLGFLVGE